MTNYTITVSDKLTEITADLNRLSMSEKVTLQTKPEGTTSRFGFAEDGDVDDSLRPRSFEAPSSIVEHKKKLTRDLKSALKSRGLKGIKIIRTPVEPPLSADKIVEMHADLIRSVALEGQQKSVTVAPPPSQLAFKDVPTGVNVALPPVSQAPLKAAMTNVPLFANVVKQDTSTVAESKKIAESSKPLLAAPSPTAAPSFGALPAFNMAAFSVGAGFNAKDVKPLPESAPTEADEDGEEDEENFDEEQDYEDEYEDGDFENEEADNYDEEYSDINGEDYEEEDYGDEGEESLDEEQASEPIKELSSRSAFSFGVPAKPTSAGFATASNAQEKPPTLFGAVTTKSDSAVSSSLSSGFSFSAVNTKSTSKFLVSKNLYLRGW
jgi:hypothetical protein